MRTSAGLENIFSVRSNSTSTPVRVSLDSFTSAVKNAQLAQTPLVLLGGATATVLKGRGALQDIDQRSLLRSATKWATSVSARPQLRRVMEQAFDVARAGVPGPVFVEVPVDLLYDETTVRTWYMKESGVQNATGLGSQAGVKTYATTLEFIARSRGRRDSVLVHELG